MMKIVVENDIDLLYIIIKYDLFIYLNRLISLQLLYLYL